MTTPLHARDLPTTLPEHLSYAGWQALGHKLGAWSRGMQWVIAAWVEYGEAHFSERFSQGVEETGLAPQTILNILSVARAFPPSRRRERLSWSHHEALAALPAAEQDRWLDEAEQSALSVTALRQRVRGGRPRPRVAPIHDATEPPTLVVGGLVRIESIGLCKISHIGRGATVLVTAVRL